MDVKEVTAYALEKLYDLIVPGGLIILDDYNVVPGATEAVDDFIKNNSGIVLKKSPINKVPSYFYKI